MEFIEPSEDILKDIGLMYQRRLYGFMALSPEEQEAELERGRRDWEVKEAEWAQAKAEREAKVAAHQEWRKTATAHELLLDDLKQAIKLVDDAADPWKGDERLFEALPILKSIKERLEAVER